MATPTYTPLATITLSSSASSVTFSNISQSFRDLVLVYNGTSPGAGDLRARFNSDSGSNYAWVQMSGDGSLTYSSASTGTYLIFSYTANVAPTVITANIMDYSATDKHKTCISRGNQANGRTMAYATRWANTAAITSMVITHPAGSFGTGTTFSLYGIAS